jgi:hypothetical protein
MPQYGTAAVSVRIHWKGGYEVCWMIKDIQRYLLLPFLVSKDNLRKQAAGGDQLDLPTS